MAAAIRLIHEASSIVASANDAEQDYLDNMPENLQGSQRYITGETATDEMSSAIYNLEEGMEHLSNAM